MGKTIRACLFDMDGLLINSEDIYTLSITSILKDRFNKGPLKWDLKYQLQGLPGTAASAKVIEFFDIKGQITPEELYGLTSDKQMELWGTTQYLPGVKNLISRLQNNQVPFALATSSALDKYHLKTSHLKEDDGSSLFDLFLHKVTGDDERIPKGRGKPCPDIYEIALAGLNQELISTGKIAPGEEILMSECLVFEDGLPGVEAGKAAGAYVIWVPNEEVIRIIGNEKVEELLGTNNEFGEILKTLEHFEFEKFGL